MQTITILGRVPVKKNNYKVRGDGKGLFKPKDITDFEILVAKTLQAQGAKRIEGKMQFSMTLVYEKEPDLDGAMTTIWDALQEAGMFDNDKDFVQINETFKRQSVSKEDPPRAIITIGVV